MKPEWIEEVSSLGNRKIALKAGAFRLVLRQDNDKWYFTPYLPSTGDDVNYGSQGRAETVAVAWLREQLESALQQLKEMEPS